MLLCVIPAEAGILSNCTEDNGHGDTLGDPGSSPG